MKERLWRYFVGLLEIGIALETAKDWFYGAVDFSYEEKQITEAEKNELLRRRDKLLENGGSEDD